MEAIAHSPSFAKKVGVSQSVGKDFSAADKGRKFMHGGAIAKQNTQHGKMDIPFSSLKRFSGMKGGGNVESKAMMGKEVAFMKKKGAPGSMIRHEEKEMKYAKGGSVMRPKKDIARDQMAMAPYAKGGGVRGRSGYVGLGGKENPTDGGSTAGENPKIQKRGLTEGRVIKMATGGSVKMNRGGGIESSGKTRGKMC